MLKKNTPGAGKNPRQSYLLKRIEQIKNRLDRYSRKYEKYRYLLLGTLTFLLISSFPSPAQAFLFNKLEAVVVQILSSSGSSIDSTEIQNFFNIIRVGVIFIFIVGMIYTLVQMYLQNNWVLPLLLVTGFLLAVLAIEFFSNLVLPSTTTVNNNNTGGAPLVNPRVP